MERKLAGGDYVPDGVGGFVGLSGGEEVLARVLFRLTARRGGLPFLPRLGSRLYLLSREPAARRLSAARQYVAEALAEEPVTVTDVTLSPEEQGRVSVRVLLDYQGTELSVSAAV